VIERCRSDEEQIQDLLQQKEDLEVALEEVASIFLLIAQLSGNLLHSVSAGGNQK
jgi:hypothetical protein